jgi:hypothetical protein
LIITLFNSWLTSLLTKSRKQGTLNVNDLYDPPTYLDPSTWTDKLENNWFNEIKRCPENPSLIRATLRTIGWRMIFNGFILIPNVSSHNMIRFIEDQNFRFIFGHIAINRRLLKYILFVLYRN